MCIRDSSRQARQIISSSLDLSEAYKKISPIRENTWWATNDKFVYEVEFVPSHAEKDKMGVRARIIGYEGSPTQIKVSIVEEGLESFVFIDEKGYCEHSFCPSYQRSTGEGAGDIFVTNEIGSVVRLVRRERTR